MSTLVLAYTWPAAGEKLTFSGRRAFEAAPHCAPVRLAARMRVLAQLELPAAELDAAAGDAAAGCKLGALLDAAAEPDLSDAALAAIRGLAKRAAAAAAAAHA